MAGASTANPDTCKRELVIEVPAEAVEREVERATQHFQRHARVPGFRPGKTPAGLVRQRFRAEIREEVVRKLASQYFKSRVEEEKLEPVTPPEVEDLHLDIDGREPMRFKAVFEALPSFELKDYTGLEVQEVEAVVADDEVGEALQELQEEHAAYTAVEDRPLGDGDVAAISLEGKPAPQQGRGAGDEAGAKPAPAEPVKVNDLLCHLGAPGTRPEFTENLRGLAPGEEKSFPVSYPDDYSDRRLAGRTFVYTVRVNAVKQKQVPELNDEFARDVGFSSLEELRADIRQKLLEQRRRQAEREAKDKLLDRLLELHDFPVPQTLVERQLQSRMERTARQLSARGLNPARMELDWGRVRSSHREGAERDVRADLIIDRIAEREGLQVTEAEVQQETEELVRQIGGRDPAAARARLTRQGVADTIKHRLRTDKTLEFLFRNARRIPVRPGPEAKA